MIAGPEHRLALRELVEGYREQLADQWPIMLGLLIATIVGGVAWNALTRRHPYAGERWIRSALVIGFIAAGLWLVLDRAACYDDAYISLRYVDNWVAGEGLVFNPGERVEGYTNFLWTILIAGLRVVLPIETPLIAVSLCVLAYVANLVVVERIARTIAPAWHPQGLSFPIAVALLAIQQSFVDYGTSGLETGFASLLVNLGVLALLAEGRARSMFLAGLCWILATLTRPDHAIFYAVGSAVVFGMWVTPTWRALRIERSPSAAWRAGIAPMLAYAAPFVLWLVHLAWRQHYYGELLPNTYYAKSADLTYYVQGLVYATEFHLGSHLWLAIVALVIALPFAWPEPGPARRFVAFAIPAIVLYEWYVVRVGGDFMVGRFYVSVLPLILLLGELLVRRLAVRQPDTQRPRLRPAALVLAGVLASTAIGVRLLEPNQIRWHLADENSYYRIAAWSPIVIDHDNYWIGCTLGELEARGIEPVIATGAIGLVGYYSRLETIDRLGLTDAHVAHQDTPRRRSRPGHEKYASVRYLRQRGVHFVRGVGVPKWLGKPGKIRFGGITRDWTILHYDPELMRAIRETGVDVAFEDFEGYLDQHLTRLPRLDQARVREEHAYLRGMYFDHHDDPHRQRAYEVYLEWVDAGRAPKDLLREGRWDAWKAR
jgi:hypothetical protein